MYKKDSLLDSVHKKDSLHRKAENVESLQEVGGRVGKLPQSPDEPRWAREMYG